MALGRLLRSRPATLALALTVVAVAIIVEPMAWIVRLLSTGYEPVVEFGRWWTLVVSQFLTRGILELVVVVVLILLLVGVSETLMGRWRTLLAFFFTAVGGALIGIGIQSFALSVGETWSRTVIEINVSDPFTPIAGTLMTASGFASPLWRRRIRWLTLLTCLVFLLYYGEPSGLYRMIAAVLGLGLGVILRPELRLETWIRSSSHELRVLMSAVLAVASIGPVIAIFSSTRYGLLSPIALLLGNDTPASGGSVQCHALNVTSECIKELTLERIDNPGSVLVSILPLVALLLAAWGLLRGRRFAVWFAIVANTLLGVLAAFYFGILPLAGTTYVIDAPKAATWESQFSLLVSILLPLTIAIMLAVVRRRFVIFTPVRSVVLYVATVVVAGVGLAVAYVGVGLAFATTGFSRPVGVADLTADVIERFLPVSFLHRVQYGFLPTDPVTSALYYGVGPAFWILVVVAALKPMLGSAKTAERRDVARVHDVLRVGGGDALSYMATWPGNSCWFDPIEDFAVAYRVVGRVALTIGGPFGSRDPPGRSIARFAEYCDDQGWLPVLYSVDSTLAPMFHAMGWTTTVVAEETVIHPQQWQTVGKKWQDVRTSINRAQRAGISAVWTSWSALSIGTTTQLADMSESWVAEKNVPEMGFTLGGLDELKDPAVRLMLAMDEAGTVHAVTSWLPNYCDGRVVGWTLDFMRRRPDSANGVMEFLIAESAVRMRDDGIEFMSLSAAPLAQSAAAHADPSPVDRLLSYISESLEPVYGFRSLLNFKRKFQPEFRPLILAYPDPSSLPAIGLALTRAYLPSLSLRQVASVLREDRR